MFIFSFLSFPAMERISGQNSLKKSCSGHDFASKWSCRLSFGHKKCTELSPMDIDWPFKKCTIRISMVHHFPHVLGGLDETFPPGETQEASIFFKFFFTAIFKKIYRMPHIR